MRDLKSWFSGDGSYNLTPVLILNPSNASMNSQNGNMEMWSNVNQAQSGIFGNLFRFNGSNSIDMNKLFVIEFRDCKWHLQIDDFHSLKSITCILLDQSLDMGIDSNPLMLDLTISEHFQNRYRLFSPVSHNYNSLSTTRNYHYQNNHLSSIYHKKRNGTSDKKSAISNNSGSQVSKSFCERNRTDASPPASIAVNRNHSMVDSECNSESTLSNVLVTKGSFSVLGGGDKAYKSGAPVNSVMNNNGFGYDYGNSIGNNNGSGGGGGGFYSRPTQATYKYELEFQELQLILLWFPEEVAIRLTEVEYELFKQVPPTEYLRHATLDMNNFKSSHLADAIDAAKVINNTNEIKTNTTSPIDIKVSPPNSTPTRSVQDLIVRYKEVIFLQELFS